MTSCPVNHCPNALICDAKCPELCEARCVPETVSISQSADCGIGPDVHCFLVWLTRTRRLSFGRRLFPGRTRCS